MQARPQSSLAARILTTTSSASRSSTKIPVNKIPANRIGSFAAEDTSPRAGRRPSSLENSLPVSEGAGLAHDAGNLLHALGLYCELLQAPGVLRPEHSHYATELRQLSERSSQMIHRLLKDFAPAARRPVASVRTETAALAAAPVAHACLNPAEALHNQSALLQRLASPWATVSVMTQDPLPGLDFSAEIIERITVNLVLNAAEALRGERNERDGRQHAQILVPPVADSAAGLNSTESEGPAPRSNESVRAGRIRVSMRMADGRLRLSVEDNGPGMPPAIAAAFLKPAPLPPGTARGLGHRIVHELAQATGGQISVRVRPGTGTTLSLDWPVKAAAAAFSDGPTLRLVSSQRASADRGVRSGWSPSQQGGPDVC